MIKKGLLFKPKTKKMKTITYSCNVCKSIYNPQDLYSVYWNQEIKPPRLHFGNLDTPCDHTHICVYCVKEIKAFEFQKLTK